MCAYRNWVVIVETGLVIGSICVRIGIGYVLWRQAKK
jgi:hypothetical protein